MKNENQVHLVLGASGAIGSAVIRELRSRELTVKALERTGKIAGVETVNVDLLNYDEFNRSVTGVTHLYLCVGLPYDYKIWNSDWPRIMENTIKVCSENNIILVFFDNVYMYGPAPLEVPFNENHSQLTESKKGVVRKKIADLVLSAIAEKKIMGVIGRSADFYGLNAKNSVLYINFLENMMRGKNPQWLFKSGIKHTYAYVEDNARALVELSLNETTYGQVWHLPVGEPITIQEILDIFNKVLAKNFKINYVPRFVFIFLSFFVSVLYEIKEMSYQFDNTYIMSSDKFLKKFPEFKITSYEDGIKQMISSFKS